ncbi:MAG TPA: asparagine--tRNA ligase [Gammaproteobacteria bacterium]|nr:asparagine--tRNA ligase [Gammaproteobacteria bacterium]HPI94805.1 asparagine--tRNA ligase [Gammaproteobacteria bacterium]HPQ86398.1 asparagine--tRNA ligase [Gammaproteobacteria bacterium]
MIDISVDISIKQALQGEIAFDTTVTIKGWVRNRRDSKGGFSFLVMHDGSCFDAIQVIADDSLENYEDEIKHLTTGCSAIITGKLVKSGGQGQSCEIQASAVEVTGMVEDPETYPVQPKRHTMEFLREVAHLRPRTNTFSAMTRVRNTLAQAVHRFFHQNGFFWISTPIITASDCEGAGDLFRVTQLDLANLPMTDKGAVDYSKDFFGKETYLTVSGQLNVETHAMALSKVYTFGPTFRAENSNTTRHLAEFWMIEPEVAFNDLSDNADLAEDFLKFVFKAVLNENPDDMQFFDQFVQKGVIERLESFQNDSFARVEYTDAIEILQKSGQDFEYKPEWGADLQTEHERYLTEKHFKKPTVIMNYPKSIKPFYMHCNDDNKTVAAMDVLVPGVGELIGGSQREARVDVLLERMKEHHLNLEEYKWYIDLRRYGTAPHAGFGLGFERLVSYVTGINNIRDVIAFPRTPGNARF